MPVCPMCSEDIEKGMYFRNKWICTDCVKEISQGYLKMIEAEREVWNEVNDMKKKFKKRKLTK